MSESQLKAPRNILTQKQTEEKIGMNRITIWRHEKDGKFPLRVKLTDKKIGWFEDEIDAWLESRPRGICARAGGAKKEPP